jgi:hypothetical protein
MTFGLLADPFANGIRIRGLMTTKIRIDLSQGIIEAEGSEEFVRSIYGDLKARLDAMPTAPQPSAKDIKGGTTPPVRPTREKTRRSSYTPKIVKDLDLSGKNGNESLKAFFGKYEAATNFERNLIFVYYLRQICERSPVKMDDVFTCYRTVGIKAPEDLYSSLFDTARHKGWVEVRSAEDVDITVPGINHLEHDLPKKKANEGAA